MAVFGCTVVRGRRYGTVFLCSSMTALAGLVLTAKLVFHEDSSAVEKTGSFQTATPSANTMAATHTSSQSKQKKPHCVKIPAVNGVSSPLCVKENDLYVSRALLEGRVWERAMVANVLAAVRLHPGSVFIDGGCNLGLYTALVAAMGGKVVAIDGMADNIALLRHR